MISSNLVIENLQTELKLGVSEEERSKLQRVAWNINIQLKKPKLAKYEDDYEQVVCYGRLCNLISDICLEKEYKLIEYLCYKVFSVLKDVIGNAAESLEVKVTKLNPPVTNLIGGASFIIRG